MNLRVAGIVVVTELLIQGQTLGEIPILECLAVFRVLAVIDHSGAALFHAGAFRRNTQTNVGVALFLQLDTEVQIAHTRSALAKRDRVDGAGAALGIGLDVLVQVDHVLHTSFLAAQRDQGGHHHVAGGRGAGVGDNDVAFQLRDQQIVPGLGVCDAVCIVPVLVIADAENALQADNIALIRRDAGRIKRLSDKIGDIRH